jgi:hypothetical protein
METAYIHMYVLAKQEALSCILRFYGSYMLPTYFPQANRPPPRSRSANLPTRKALQLEFDVHFQKGIEGNGHGRPSSAVEQKLARSLERLTVLILRVYEADSIWARGTRMKVAYCSSPTAVCPYIYRWSTYSMYMQCNATTTGKARAH